MQASTIKAALSRKVVAGVVFVAVATVAFALTSTTKVEGRGSICEGDQKTEGSKADYVAPDGMRIDYVCIKAGRDVFTFYCGETDKSGCYSLKWTEDADGCCSAVSISGGGTGRDCKEISHTAVTFAKGDCKKDPPPK